MLWPADPWPAPLAASRFVREVFGKNFTPVGDLCHPQAPALPRLLLPATETTMSGGSCYTLNQQLCCFKIFQQNQHFCCFWVELLQAVEEEYLVSKCINCIVYIKIACIHGFSRCIHARFWKYSHAHISLHRMYTCHQF